MDEHEAGSIEQQQPESEIHLSGFPVPDCTAFIERQTRRIVHTTRIARIALTRVETFLGDLPRSLHGHQEQE